MNPSVDITGKSQKEVMQLINNFQRELESEKKFHDTLDNLLEGFQMISFDWKYMYVNHTVVKQSRFTRQELIGRTMMEKYPGIETTPLFKTLSLCMSARVANHFENEFTYSDGSKGWFELSIQPVEGGLVILSNEITARKKAEQQKTDYTLAIEEMIFMNSHNLRQPVTHILGLINLIETCNNNAEELKKISAHIKEAAQSLDKYTQELTGYIHNQKLKTKK